MNDLGTVTIDGDHTTLTFERRLPFPIERVWAAVTDPAERRAWLGTTRIEDGSIVIEPEDPPAPPDAKRVTGRVLTHPPRAVRAQRAGLLPPARTPSSTASGPT